MALTNVTVGNTWQSLVVAADICLWCSDIANVYFATGATSPATTGVNDVLIAGMKQRIFIKSGATVWLKADVSSSVLYDADIIFNGTGSTPPPVTGIGGVYVPTFTAGTGVSSVTDVLSAYSASYPAIGQIAFISSTFDVVASDSNMTLDFTTPPAINGAFGDAAKFFLLGTNIKFKNNNNFPASNILSVLSTATNKVEVKMNGSLGTETYRVTVSGMYIIGALSAIEEI
jgi:hypothetical protein